MDEILSLICKWLSHIHLLCAHYGGRTSDRRLHGCSCTTSYLGEVIYGVELVVGHNRINSKLFMNISLAQQESQGHEGI